MSTLHVENLFAVAGKVVLVTGGSRGIGKMVCPKNLTARGGKDLVFLADCLRIREERCQGVYYNLLAHGRDLTSVPP